MSGRLPPPGERSMRLCSIMLGAIWLAVSLRKSGVRDRERRIYPNLYSTYSANTSAAVLLLSYHGLNITGDGTLQDKLDNFSEFRAELALRAENLVEAYMRETRTRNPLDCAEAIRNLFA